jgi:hypothetical protein
VLAGAVGGLVAVNTRAASGYTLVPFRNAAYQAAMDTETYILGWRDFGLSSR